MHRCAHASGQTQTFEFNELEAVEESLPPEFDSMSRFKNGGVPIWAVVKAGRCSNVKQLHGGSQAAGSLAKKERKACLSRLSRQSFAVGTCVRFKYSTSAQTPAPFALWWIARTHTRREATPVRSRRAQKS